MSDESGTVAERVEELRQRRYWYQSVPVDGVLTPSLSGWAESRFYNRGKWDNFIAPLLPRDASGLSLVELGCNAGLLLLFAAEHGFSRVTGVEGDDEWFRQARFVLDHYATRDPDTYGRIDLVHARIGPQGFGSNASCNIRSSAPELDPATLAGADFVIAANVLYWIEHNTALRFIDALAAMTRHCLVVSIEATSQMGGPCSASEVRAAFESSWTETAAVDRIEPSPDEPAARPMFSILFTSKRF